MDLGTPVVEHWRSLGRQASL